MLGIPAAKASDRQGELMDYGISTKTAMVIGGSKGIGLAVSTMLASEGCKVAVVARTQSPIDRAVSGIRSDGGIAEGFSGDMSDRAEIERTVAAITSTFGAPDIVVSQADFHVRGFFDEITELESYVDSFRSYTMSQVYLLHAVLPAMRKQGWGRFVHIGSGTAKEPQMRPPHTVANATRPSTVGLLKSVADEFARDGVTINVVAPGWIATRTTTWYLEQHEGLMEKLAQRAWLIEKAGVPAGRAGEPEEIASTIVYLCSDKAGYLTGHYITVDGGLHRAAF